MFRQWAPPEITFLQRSHIKTLILHLVTYLQKPHLASLRSLSYSTIQYKLYRAQHTMITTNTLLHFQLFRARAQARLTFRRRISAEARRKRDRCIRRRALQIPARSAFVVLLGSGCDQSLITLTGFDRRGFYYLLERFGVLITSTLRIHRTDVSERFGRRVSAGYCAV